MLTQTPPPPRMTMAERLQKRLDEDRARGNAMDVPSPSASSPEDDRLSAMIRGVNEKTAARGARHRDGEEILAMIPGQANAGTLPDQPDKANRDFAMEVPSPIGPEASEPVNEQSVEEREHAEKLEYARLYRESAMRAREKNIVNQTRIAEERAKLLQLPSAPKPSGINFRIAERAPDPLPKVDSQRVYETDYGPRMILSVDESTRPPTMYFATPEERRRVDAALVRDESQSSMGAADFRNVVALSPDQARKFLNKPVEAATRDMAMEVPSPIPQDPRHLQRRYGQSAA